MANRVLLGNRNGTMGLYISKPGVDVFSASVDQMLLSTDMQTYQVVQSGIYSVPSSGSFPIYVNIPNLGYKPVIRWSCDGWYACLMTYNGPTQLIFTLSDTYGQAGYLRYQVLGLPNPW